ncbi:unnamed protein product [Trichogramma brassicae]|uniref:Uncharacterized protein n=1 Tax=Trichogramma brassicae TaxID=86971 RepID=A0A6H5IEM2_9HYME|nr:unnamed protein product [Trichogramma brassicae]
MRYIPPPPPPPSSAETPSIRPRATPPPPPQKQAASRPSAEQSSRKRSSLLNFAIWSNFRHEVLEPALKRIDKLFVVGDGVENKEHSIPSQSFHNFASAVAQELPRFRMKHIQTLVDVVYYRCHRALRVEPTKALRRLRHEFHDQSETPLLLQVHFGCTIVSSDYNIVLDYDRFAKTFADNFYRQKNYYLRNAGHMHGADKLARFPKVSYAHFYMQHDKILKRHQARPNEVFVLALTRGTSFHGKCKDTIKRLQQLQAWFSKARDTCDFRFEIVANFHSLKATKIEALQAEEWKSANVPLKRSRVPDERSAIITELTISFFFSLQLVMDELYRSRVLVLIPHWKEYLVRTIGPEIEPLHRLSKSLNKQVIFPKFQLAALNFAAEKITCFIEGTRNRYDAELLDPRKVYVTDHHVRYDLTTSLLDNSFFTKREASFNYVGGHASLNMRLLYVTAGDGDDLITLNGDYVVDKLFRLVAFWRRYRIGHVCINTNNLDIAEYYQRVPSDDKIKLFCSVNDVVKSLLNPSDSMLACLLSSLNHSLETSTLESKTSRWTLRVSERASQNNLCRPTRPIGRWTLVVSKPVSARCSRLFESRRRSEHPLGAYSVVVRKNRLPLVDLCFYRSIRCAVDADARVPSGRVGAHRGGGADDYAVHRQYREVTSAHRLIAENAPSTYLSSKPCVATTNCQCQREGHQLTPPPPPKRLCLDEQVPPQQEEEEVEEVEDEMDENPNDEQTARIMCALVDQLLGKPCCETSWKKYVVWDKVGVAARVGNIKDVKGEIRRIIKASTATQLANRYGLMLSEAQHLKGCVQNTQAPNNLASVSAASPSR